MLMDEPFSAVDPVVREQLQNEFLRLQGELGKTIVFVTHDIDEAIKLGDQVAVLRVGGQLAQLATPAELLARPADAFVAGFVGRDRGYRALGFAAAGDLPLDRRASRRARYGPGATPPSTAADGWVLVVDDDDRPAGLALDRRPDADALTGADHPGPAQPRRHARHRGGTLREALDAALSSPSGRGVVVDDDGRLAGTVTRRRGAAPGSRSARPAIRSRSAAGAPSMSAVWQYFTDHQSEIWQLDLDHGLAGGRCRSSSGSSSRCRSAGWPAATAGLYPPLVTAAGIALHDPVDRAVPRRCPASSAPRSSTRSTSRSR